MTRSPPPGASIGDVRLAREPVLDARYLEPPGFRWGSHSTADGAVLRWGCLETAVPVAVCILLGGFTEFIEKYFETARWFADRGISVWCLDWRDQGGSARSFPAPARPGGRDYRRDVEDLVAFAKAELPACLPRLLVAHSMGAAIALFCLGEKPGLFDAAILSAPMLEIQTAGLSASLARRIARALRRAGFGRLFVPGSRRHRPQPDSTPGNSRTSHDAVRCLLQYAWFETRPFLKVGGPTYAWVESTLDFLTLLGREDYLRAIDTPILLGSAGIEHFVEPRAQARAAGLLADCTLVTIAEARHELFQESDVLRTRWRAAIDLFLQSKLRVRQR